MIQVLHYIGVVFLTCAVILKLSSYYKQIQKTKKAKKSSQVSSSAFLCKMGEYIFSLIALVIYENYLGALIAVAGIAMCTWALRVIIKTKPKGWKLV